MANRESKDLSPDDFLAAASKALINFVSHTKQKRAEGDDDYEDDWTLSERASEFAHCVDAFADKGKKNG